MEAYYLDRKHVSVEDIARKQGVSPLSIRNRILKGKDMFRMKQLDRE